MKPRAWSVSTTGSRHSTAAFLRVNVDESVTDNPLGNLRDRTVADARPINGVLTLNQILSPSMLNEMTARLQPGCLSQLAYHALPYTLRVTGFTTVSSARTREEDDTSAAIIDNLTFTRGRHTIKAGVEVRRVLIDPGSSADGTLTFTSRNNFLSNILDSANVTSTLPLKRLRKTQVFSFLQDEYKARFHLHLESRRALFVLQRVPRNAGPSRAVRLRHLRRTLPARGRILDAAHHRYRPARRLCMGSTEVQRPHRGPRRRRHLPRRRANGRPEPSRVERRRRILAQLAADSRACVSHCAFPRDGPGNSLAARAKSQPEG